MAVMLPDRRCLAPDGRGGSSLPPGGEPPYDPAMEARVAVLEQIAKDTRDTLVRIEGDTKDMFARFERDTKDFLGQIDRRLDRLETHQRSDFRWLLGMGFAAAGSIVAVMAHGFHWF